MQIANKDEKEIIAVLVAMIKRMGYKNDHPDKEYSWWYNNDGVFPFDLINTETLMDNDVAMQHFLLRVINKIGISHDVRIDFIRYECSVQIVDKSISHRSKSLNEALFLSINDYINKK